MIYYVDASIVVAVVAREANSDLIDPFIDNPASVLLLSNFALAESSAALAKNGRIKRKPEVDVQNRYAELDAWSLVVADRLDITPDDIAEATTTVRGVDFALRAPDAIHIAASRRLGATLLTLDRGMARAAAALGVNCINPAEADEPGMKD